MNLLNSGEAIQFLANSAPRAWVKRMLYGMICSNEITPYFTSGKVTCSAHRKVEFLKFEKDGISEDQIFKNIHKHHRKLSKQFENIDDAMKDNREHFEVVDFEFSPEEDDPRPASVGVFCILILIGRLVNSI